MSPAVIAALGRIAFGQPHHARMLLKFQSRVTHSGLRKSHPLTPRVTATIAFVSNQKHRMSAGAVAPQISQIPAADDQ